MVSEHASPLADIGGVEAGGRSVHVHELSAALTRCGHQVTVYTRRDDPYKRTELVTREGYRVIHVPAGPSEPMPKERILPHLGEFGTFLQRHWATNTPDLVHAHFWMSGLAAELAARSRGIPVVLTFHSLGTVKRRYEGPADPSPRSRIRFERLIAARAAHVVATCSAEAVELGRMGVPRFRISIVPPGVDRNRFTPDGPTAERPPWHRVLSVGRLVRRKGFETAIKSLQDLPGTELLIAGGDDAEDSGEGRRLHRVAVDYAVQDRVRLIGPVPRRVMPRLLRSADVVLCTPWYEPSGMVPLEAMACGKPVVSTAVGGIVDTVVDGVTGRLVASPEPITLARTVLVEPPEPVAIARAVQPLLDDATLRETWGAAGCQRARSRYTWDRVAAETLMAYHRAVPARAAEVISPAS